MANNKSISSHNTYALLNAKRRKMGNTRAHSVLNKPDTHLSVEESQEASHLAKLVREISKMKAQQERMKGCLPFRL